MDQEFINFLKAELGAGNHIVLDVEALIGIYDSDETLAFHNALSDDEQELDGLEYDDAIRALIDQFRARNRDQFYWIETNEHGTTAYWQGRSDVAMTVLVRNTSLDDAVRTIADVIVADCEYGFYEEAVRVA